ncbi:hypothetical protein [Novosphingobium olei]|uniref:hypothetical protein n=1 Tax=Novosphingobium olei TaxID=2728851 RepID=UPI00308AA15D|nr:hypothetical protein NSDW_33320 [Novosphingobium olei]
MTVLDQQYLFTAERRAIAQYLADLPEPAEYLRELPLPVVEALHRAVLGRQGWTAMAEDVRLLRYWGLCDFPTSSSNGRQLTNLACAVRKLLAD